MRMTWWQWIAQAFRPGRKSVKARTPVTGRKPVVWECRERQGGAIIDRVRALTKSEARAEFKRRLDCRKRLPAHLAVSHTNILGQPGA